MPLKKNVRNQKDVIWDLIVNLILPSIVRAEIPVAYYFTVGEFQKEKHAVGSGLVHDFALKSPLPGEAATCIYLSGCHWKSSRIH